jgi:hypothetical protein
VPIVRWSAVSALTPRRWKSGLRRFFSSVHRALAAQRHEAECISAADRAMPRAISSWARNGPWWVLSASQSIIARRRPRSQASHNIGTLPPDGVKFCWRGHGPSRRHIAASVSSERQSDYCFERASRASTSWIGFVSIISFIFYPITKYTGCA